MRLPILALAVSAFAIGTTEFVVMGLLPQMAQDLGVSIPATGMLVSGYALGVVLGGPLLAMATARLPRNHPALPPGVPRQPHLVAESLRQKAGGDQQGEIIQSPLNSSR